MNPTLGLITLAAEDWYETVDFYANLLSLPVLESDEVAGRARLRAGSGLILEIVSGGWGAEAPKSPRENPVSFALRVPDLGRTIAELEHRGVWFLGEAAGGLAALADPEGNRLYLYNADTPPPAPDGWEQARTAPE